MNSAPVPTYAEIVRNMQVFYYLKKRTLEDQRN